MPSFERGAQAPKDLIGNDSAFSSTDDHKGVINLHNKSLADAANTEKRVFRKLSVEEAHLANALADKTKQHGFKHWDEYYPTLEIFELDAAAGELFGCFVDEKLVSIITVSFSKEEIEDEVTL